MGEGYELEEQGFIHATIQGEANDQVVFSTEVLLGGEAELELGDLAGYHDVTVRLCGHEVVLAADRSTAKAYVESKGGELDEPQ